MWAQSRGDIDRRQESKPRCCQADVDKERLEQDATRAAELKTALKPPPSSLSRTFYCHSHSLFVETFARSSGSCSFWHATQLKRCLPSFTSWSLWVSRKISVVSLSQERGKTTRRWCQVVELAVDTDPSEPVAASELSCD